MKMHTVSASRLSKCGGGVGKWRGASGYGRCGRWGARVLARYCLCTKVSLIGPSRLGSRPKCARTWPRLRWRAGRMLGKCWHEMRVWLMRASCCSQVCAHAVSQKDASTRQTRACSVQARPLPYCPTARVFSRAEGVCLCFASLLRLPQLRHMLHRHLLYSRRPPSLRFLFANMVDGKRASVHIPPRSCLTFIMRFGG
jgi:hypothetical protein